MCSDRLSKSMKSHEVAMVYSVNQEYRYDHECHGPPKIISHYSISSAESQGFTWNQDLFASQYQQAYRVEYDGSNDNNYNFESQNGRPRRKSENCFSLSYDAKNGTHQEANYDCIDVDEETVENTYFKSLLRR